MVFSIRLVCALPLISNSEVGIIDADNSNLDWFAPIPPVATSNKVIGLFLESGDPIVNLFELRLIQDLDFNTYIQSGDGPAPDIVSSTLTVFCPGMNAPTVRHLDAR